MSLYGNNPRYTFGAIRNAQLAPFVFPGWRLRVYVEEPRLNGSTTYGRVPERMLRKLTSLGVEIVAVDVAAARIPPLMWRFLVADDLNVTRFIVRDADGRLSERDAAVVDAWIDTGAAFHCIRDHPVHATHPVLGGMWGGRPRELAGILWAPWSALMKGYKNEYALDMYFLGKTIWRKMQPHAFCHDSVSCGDWPRAHPFPVRRVGTEHIGQVFDAHGRPRLVDINALANTPVSAECTVQHNTSTTKTVSSRIDTDGTADASSVAVYPGTRLNQDSSNVKLIGASIQKMDGDVPVIVSTRMTVPLGSKTKVAHDSSKINPKTLLKKDDDVPTVVSTRVTVLPRSKTKVDHGTNSLSPNSDTHLNQYITKSKTKVARVTSGVNLNTDKHLNQHITKSKSKVARFISGVNLNSDKRLINQDDIKMKPVPTSLQTETGNVPKIAYPITNNVGERRTGNVPVTYLDATTGRRGGLTRREMNKATDINLTR